MHKHPHKTETSAQPVSARSAGELGVTSGPNEQVQKGRSHAVQVRAYQKWEAAGKPKGDGVNFWIEAEQELLHAK